MGMTTREFLESVAKIEGLSEVLKNEVAERIAKLDKSNETRRNKPSKVQLENVAIKEQIVATLRANGTMTANAVGVAVGISTNKASALLQQIANEGLATTCDIKEPKKSKVKGYTLKE